jgi:hypothetical protein
MTTEPLTPIAVEGKLRQLVNDLACAQVVLREARDGEVDARHEYAGRAAAPCCRRSRRRSPGAATP